MLAGTRSVSQSTAVCFFASSSCVTTSKLRLSHIICLRKRGVRGVSSVVCYAVLCPLSGGLCGLLCRVMPWSGCVRVMSVYKGYPDMSCFDQGIPCWVVCPFIKYITEYIIYIIYIIYTYIYIYPRSSVSVSAATRLAYLVWYNTYLDMYYTYADLIFIFLSEAYDLFQLVCVLFCFYLFSSSSKFPLQSYWSLSCDHGLHCSHDELMWTTTTIPHVYPY